MRFSIEKKFVYLAYPKTGSTSIRSLLDPISDHRILKRKGQYHDHWTAEEYKTIFSHNGWVWSDFYSFLTIRNPWDKYVSNYFYSKPDLNFKPWYESGYDDSTANQCTFDVWLKHFLVDTKKPPHGCPSLTYFSHASGKSIVNDIFTIENFEETALPILVKRKILPPNTVLARLNTTSRKNYRDYYTKDTARLIGEFCKDEITMGNYLF